VSDFEHYRVGGFVRDTLLGKSPEDVDYVVVGETPESMIARGFVQVGGHFPVFLHPETKDEYALARSERSTGDGYADFEFVWEGVTLAEDLRRRDLTINAMAMTEDGKVIDLYGGQLDLLDGVLRHVSPHFGEDPLRILRVARFAARLRFSVADETRELMRQMVAQDMLAALPAERLWAETKKALLSPAPKRFFEVLDECGALEVVFPEIHALKGVVQRADYHAEGDAYVHTLMVLDEAASLSAGLPVERRLRVRLGALLHDLGKALTPHEHLYHADGSVRGSHPGHDDPDRFGPALEALAARLKMPSRYAKFAYRCALVHQHVHRIQEGSGRALVNLYDDLDLCRTLRYDADFLDDVAMVCAADNRGRRTLMADGSVVQPTRYPQGDWFKSAMMELHALPVGQWMQQAMRTTSCLESAKGDVLGQRRTFAKTLSAEIQRAAGVQS
jgi:tRNA nucleotidyltransferase (CCA-adding enzyme)